LLTCSLLYSGCIPSADINPVAIVDPSIDWNSVGGLEHRTTTTTPSPSLGLAPELTTKVIVVKRADIKALKEMVLLPLLYPEIFDRFGIMPPRGVLFYGPPGTGKTLMARALASTCSQVRPPLPCVCWRASSLVLISLDCSFAGQSGTKVSFFMRKGADCLSKWVGEAERQLRLLFDQARLLQPSIIFFDEIDGASPFTASQPPLLFL